MCEVLPVTIKVFDNVVTPDTLRFPVNTELFETLSPVPEAVAKSVPPILAVPELTRPKVVLLKYACPPTSRLF